MWHDYNYHEPQSQDTVLNQRVYCNSLLRLNNRPIPPPANGCCAFTIADIWDETRNQFKPWEIDNNFGMTWLMYYSLISAIPRLWKFYLVTPHLIDNHVYKYDAINNRGKVSSWVYKDKTQSQDAVRAVGKVWSKKLDVQMDVIFTEGLFSHIYEISQSTKLRDFQFRLLHNKIFCNDILVHWKKVSSNLCDFCSTSKQSIQHLLYNCRVIRPIWKKLEAKLKIRCDIATEFTLPNVVFNAVHGQKNHVTNLLVLIAKQYFYRCKCLGDTPSYSSLVHEMKLQRDIEIYNGFYSNITKIKRKWSPVHKLLQNNV